MHDSPSISRRAALGVLAAAGVGYAAFGPRGSRDPLARGRVQLTYWEKWTGHEALSMQRLVDKFNQSQDRIYVRYLSMTMIEQKAMVAVAGGSPPDVIGLYNKNLPLFAESKAILPLGEMAEKRGLTKQTYADAIWRQCNVSVRDRDSVMGPPTLYGMPNTCSTMALYYNKQLMVEAGYDATVAPTSIAQLELIAEELTIIDASKPGAGRFVRLGFTPSEPGWWPHVWAPHFGGSLYDRENDKATAASDACVRAYEWVQTYPDKLGVQDVMGFQSGLGSYSSAEQPLLSGRVAMCLHGPFLVNVIKQFKPDFPFGVAPFPCQWGSDTATPPTGLVETDVLVIPSNCKHPEEAFEFIAFVQQAENMEELCIEHAKPSPLAACSEGYYARHPNPYIRVHEEIARSPRGFGYPETRVWNEYENVFRRTFERDIWQLSMKARDALTQVQTTAQAAIDLARERRRLRA